MARITMNDNCNWKADCEFEEFNGKWELKHVHSFVVRIGTTDLDVTLTANKNHSICQMLESDYAMKRMVAKEYENAPAGKYFGD